MFIKINEERFRISTIKRYKKQVVTTGNSLLIWFTGEKMFTAFKFEDVSIINENNISEIDESLLLNKLKEIIKKNIYIKNEINFDNENYSYYQIWANKRPNGRLYINSDHYFLELEKEIKLFFLLNKS